MGRNKPGKKYLVKNKLQNIDAYLEVFCLIKTYGHWQCFVSPFGALLVKKVGPTWNFYTQRPTILQHEEKRRSIIYFVYVFHPSF